MITSKEEYLKYVNADSLALGISKPNLRTRLISVISPNPIWKFQKTMRRLEYYSNCKKGFLGNINQLYLRYKYKKISLKLGFSIPINVFGPGLCIVHYGTIVINRNTNVGANCRLHACVNIGASGGKPEAPQLGDNIYIAPGAKIYGDITIANNTAIGANAVVNKSFEKENTIIAGIPAKIVGNIDIKKLIRHG